MCLLFITITLTSGHSDHSRDVALSWEERPASTPRASWGRRGGRCGGESWKGTGWCENTHQEQEQRKNPWRRRGLQVWVLSIHVLPTCGRPGAGQLAEQGGHGMVTSSTEGSGRLWGALAGPVLFGQMPRQGCSTTNLPCSAGQLEKGPRQFLLGLGVALQGPCLPALCS